MLSRVGDDVAVLSRGIRTAIPTVFSAGVLVFIATVGMFGLDWRLGLAGAGALPAYGLALRWYLPGPPRSIGSSGWPRPIVRRR